jgi:hypothetical protein
MRIGSEVAHSPQAGSLFTTSPQRRSRETNSSGVAGQSGAQGGGRQDAVGRLSLDNMSSAHVHVHGGPRDGVLAGSNQGASAGQASRAAARNAVDSSSRPSAVDARNPPLPITNPPAAAGAQLPGAHGNPTAAAAADIRMRPSSAGGLMRHAIEAERERDRDRDRDRDRAGDANARRERQVCLNACLHVYGIYART